jgi:hypothetical protein
MGNPDNIKIILRLLFLALAVKIAIACIGVQFYAIVSGIISIAELPPN